MSKNNTRRQHYVPQMYLKGWAIDDEILYCLRKGKIFPTSTNNIAHERDFYQIRELSQEDLSFIEHFLKDLPPVIVSFFSDFLKGIQLLLSIKSNATHLGSNGDLLISTTEITLNNIIEKLLSDFEGGATEFIKEMRIGSVDFWDDEDKFLEFINFVSFQFTRTKAQEENAKYVLKGNYSGAFQILRLIMAFVLSYRINAQYEKWGVTLLKNNTSLPFITGDQPAINISKVKGDEVVDFVLYYPVSPVFAILINQKQVGDNSKMYKEINNADCVDNYNQRIIEFSFDSIYASGADILERYK